MYAVQFVDSTIASMEGDLPYSKTINDAIDIFCETYGSFNDDNTFEYKVKENSNEFYSTRVRIHDTDDDGNLVDKIYTVAELLQNVGQITINQHWRDFNDGGSNLPTSNS